MLFFPLINVKMPTIVGILTFMSRKKFMLSSVVELSMKKHFMTSGPGKLTGEAILVLLPLFAIRVYS